LLPLWHWGGIPEQLPPKSGGKQEPDNGPGGPFMIFTLQLPFDWQVVWHCILPLPFDEGDDWGIDGVSCGKVGDWGLSEWNIKIEMLLNFEFLHSSYSSTESKSRNFGCVHTV